MGRRKKKSSTKSKTNKTIGLDFLGGVFIVLGIIILIFFSFTNSGVIATDINELFLGLFGLARFVMPVAFIYVGVQCIASEKGIYIFPEIMKGIVAMILLSSSVYIFAHNRFDIGDGVADFIKWGYVGAINGANLAGLVGSVIANATYNLFGIIVTRIVLATTTILSLLYFFNLGLRQVIYAIYNVFATIFEWFANMFKEVFVQDEEQIKERENRKRKRALDSIRKNEMKESKLVENSKDASKLSVKEAASHQLMFDLDNLDKDKNDNKVQEQRDDFFKKQKEVKEEKDIKEVLQLDHIKHAADEAYIFPPIDLLGKPAKKSGSVDKKLVHDIAIKLQKTLASFGVEAKVTNITKGPTVTRYELSPSVGVKVSKIVNLADDIALNLAAKSIRIEAPIPGRAAVGIEVPNVNNEAVFLREVIESKKFDDASSKLAFALGKDTSGDITLGDVAKMPHVLIAGATGSGKSVCINSLITSILYKSKPSEVKLILIDPKMVELSGYNGVPHLLIPVVTDPRKAAGALNWAVQEMVNRYTLFASKSVKDISGYNKVIEGEEGVKLPQIVVIIDELADLMMVAPNDVEDAICRLAQMARAAGMHLVIATQRPSVDVITGIIKANIPSRIAFTVSSQIDSRTILDMAGAEKLLGKGDMLYFPVGEIKPQRMQGAFVSEKEVESIVSFIKNNSEVTYNQDILETIENKTKKGKDDMDNETDEYLQEAIDIVVDLGQASASMLQRKFKIGSARAGRIIDQMEERGIVSGYEGSKPRKTLITKTQLQELRMTEDDEEQVEE